MAITDGLMQMADTVQIGNAISAAISPAFKEASIGMGLVYAETCSPASQIIKFRKSGSLVAEAVTEGAAYAASDANSDINDTSVTATAAKIAVASPISVEAMRFGGGAANVARVAAEQGRALARKFDDDLLALFDSVTNTATATSTLDTDTLLTGQYKVMDSLVPPGPLVAVLDNKGAAELRKLVANAGAAIYSSQYNSPLFGTPSQNNFIGNLLGIDIYQTTGLSTTGGDDQGLIFNPNYAFCAAMGGSVESVVQFSGMGVALLIPGFSDIVLSWLFYGVALWNDAAACEIRSDT
jgi:putative hemolysin